MLDTPLFRIAFSVSPLSASRLCPRGQPLVDIVEMTREFDQWITRTLWFGLRREHLNQPQLHLDVVFAQSLIEQQKTALAKTGITFGVSGNVKIQADLGPRCQSSEYSTLAGSTRIPSNSMMFPTNWRAAEGGSESPAQRGQSQCRRRPTVEQR